MIRSVGWVAITVIAPPVPAGTIAMLAVMAPVSAFSVDTPGCAEPAGQAVRKPSGPLGTTVMLVAYAWAVAGIPQAPEITGKFRPTPPAREGAPNVPAG